MNDKYKKHMTDKQIKELQNTLLLMKITFSSAIAAYICFMWFLYTVTH